MKLKYLILLLIPIVQTSCAYGQEQYTETDSLYSAVLKQMRPIQIVYPRNFKSKTAEPFELLYCLDGIPSALKLETAFLQSEGFIPEQIIMVGIPNVSVNGLSMRDRNLTPTPVGYNSGEAALFLEFIKTELMPYLQKKLNVKSSGNSLYGASLAGLFTIYTFLKSPSLFTSYLAIDPSLWWDNFYIKNVMLKSFELKIPLNNTLWIAGRTGSAYQTMGIAGIDSLLQRNAPDGLQWKCQSYTNETHYSTQLKGFWDGMKFSYGGFYSATKAYPASRKIILKPVTGTVLRNRAFPLICSNLAADEFIRYTTNGTVPTVNSPKLSGEQTPVRLTKDARITLKSFGIREAYNNSGSASFKIGKTLSATKRMNGAKQGGLHYAFFQGEWDKLPDFSQLKPDSTGYSGKNFDPNSYKKEAGFACIMNGFIEIAKKGYYIFTKVEGNDDTKVFLKDQLILGAVSGLLSNNEESYIIPLEKGFYPFRITYWHKKGGKNLQPIYIRPEHGEDFPISADMLYHAVPMP